MKVNHQFLEKEFFIPNWKVNHLFIGTFNPNGGHPVNYFYGRESNYFWNVISEIFKDDLTPFGCDDLKVFFEKLKHHKIGCMDLIKSVEFNENNVDVNDVIGNGYSDSKIINGNVVREYTTEIILDYLINNPETKIYSTWGNGSKFREWNNELDKFPNDKIIKLVSPSRAARVPKGSIKFDYILNDWTRKIVL